MDELATISLENVCIHGHLDIAAKLLEEGGNRSDDDWREFHLANLRKQAAKEGNRIYNEKLQRKLPANYSDWWQSIKTTLSLYAHANGHLELVPLLLDYGADVHARDDEYEETTSHICCILGHLEIAQLLIGQGCRCECA